MPTPAPCPGACNTAWRRAEHELALRGTPHDIPVTWGRPVHCDGCVDRVRRHLSELPDLVHAIALEPLYGTPAPPVSTTHSAPNDTTPWPGQAARLLTDYIVGGLGETADELLRLRSPRGRSSPATGPREEARLSSSIGTLLAHLEWLLQEHPLAGESHEPERLHGGALVTSGNPAATIAHWHRAALRFTKRDEAPETKRLAPCKRCGGPWLTESRDLRLIDDRPYIECQDPDCQALLTYAEYQDYVRSLTGSEAPPATATLVVAEARHRVPEEDVPEVLRGVLFDAAAGSGGTPGATPEETAA